MSLEQAIADNTAAINALIGVWSKLTNQAGHIDATGTAADTVTAAGKPVTAKPEKAVAKQEVKADPKPAATPATQPAADTAQTASSETPAASVDYPTLQKAVFALAGKSREAAAAVAASMGVKTFKELPEDKWAGALVAVNAKLAELEAA